MWAEKPGFFSTVIHFLINEIFGQCFFWLWSENHKECKEGKKLNRKTDQMGLTFYQCPALLPLLGLIFGNL